MKKLFITKYSIFYPLFFLTLLLFLLPAQTRAADCASINNNLTIDIPCAEFGGIRFRVVLDLYSNAIDPNGLYFKLTDIRSVESSSSCAFIDNNLNINVMCAAFAGVNYTLSLQNYKLPQNDWFYWKLVDIGSAGDGQNRKPVADPVSLNIDSTVPYINQQLSAHDPDNDTITYELVSPSTSTGYSSAYINPSTGMLYLTHVPAGNNSFSISFRVTDGKLFSDAATVSVQVTYLSDNNKETGKIDIPAEDYSAFATSTFNSTLLGTVGGSEPVTPRSIDLSANFPNPGDQGDQQSCVGWATAYALKSYQEKVEMGWALNTRDHLFSPAFIYNQINGGRDVGSYIYEALDLAKNKGIATLATMPYSATDYITQPSSAAFAEAAKFKAASWRKVNDTSQIKAALANRKPVVGGISVYEQLMNLSGSNSVYDTVSGSRKGGHAITIVGYDDDKYGGAFKIINSWSQNWGDKGFFWMRYNFASGGVLSEAYVLEDAENSNNVTPVQPEPTEPTPDYNTLPNLTVENWNVTYDPRPRGEGDLIYTVKNTGSGTAPLGADVNLILSENPDFTTNDHYVIYETIPFNLKTGESVYRDDGNSIRFQFPDQLSSGRYYMALWVDDLNVVKESNENDNISVGNDTITISNTLPDLEVRTWYANWDAYGNGVLTYEVINSGASATTNTEWYINLILDRDQVAGNGNEIYLFYEMSEFILQPGKFIYRIAGENPAYFNLYEDFDGYPVPSGTYYMALWVDDMDSEAESNELNNGSYSWGIVNISGYYGGSTRSGVKRSGVDTTEGNANENTPLTDPVQQGSNADGSGNAYNGKKLPPANLVWKKVEITRMENGGTRMKIIDQDKSDEEVSAHDSFAQSIDGQTEKIVDEKDEKPIYSKIMEAKAKVIFPTTSSTPMPSSISEVTPK
ncbi:MAG: hypothetical protein HQK73_05965 [Desulfamplus sp.]|nr:hypothetical protein [Desulfamplus sp.]